LKEFARPVQNAVALLEDEGNADGIRNLLRAATGSASTVVQQQDIDALMALVRTAADFENKWNQVTDVGVDDISTFLALVKNLADAIRTLLTNSANPSTGLSEALIEPLLEFLQISFFRNTTPLFYATLGLIGVIDETKPSGRRIDWGRIDNLSDPPSVMTNVYGWGTANFDADRFLRRIANLSSALGSHVTSRVLADDAYKTLDPASAQAGIAAPFVLMVPLFRRVENDSMIYAGLVVMPIARGTANAGIALVPMGMADFGNNPIGPNWTAKFDITGSEGYAVVFSPQGPAVKNLNSSGLLLDLKATVSRNPGNPVSFGLGEGFTIGADGVDLVSETVLDTARLPPTFGFTINVKGFNVKVDLTHADGFLKSVLQNGLQSGGDFSIEWSPKSGFRFTGKAGFQTTLALHDDLGPLHIEDLDLSAVLSAAADPNSKTSPTLAIEAALSFTVSFGPLEVGVEGVGVQGKFDIGDPDAPAPDASSQRYGPFGVGVGFLAPHGLSIDIDADGIGGGGFIDFDQNTGRYSGVLQLEVFSLDVQAIGLLDTKLPGGTPAYSFLLILTGQFPDIEIGFGFAISGMGGLLAIHRTMNPPALQAGVKSHSVDSVLFPENPVENAPKIIKDLSTFFPPSDGRYVFGPMADISWGEPHIVEAQIGLFIELPEPVRMALLGHLVVGLPSLELSKPLVLIHVDVVGALDMGRKALGVDATLYDSYVITSSLSGDMALRMTWGDEPNFVFSMGGFNPRYQPPPGMPTLNRLQLSLGFNDNPRINASGYFALTSNTVQFGAALQLYASSGGFSVEGLVALDALFQFAPAFSFSADLVAMVALKYDGDVIMSLSLAGSLSGPTPWHVRGSVSVDILFFSVSVGFDSTFGTDQAVSVRGQDPRPRLLEALGEPGNWSAGLPDESRTLVTFRKFEATELADRSFILVYPAGSLTVRQKVLPLDHTLALFGSAPPLGGPVKFEIAVARIQIGSGSPQPVAPAPATDDFAMAQFDVLSDSEKLAAKAFEPAQSGVSLDFDNGLASKAVGMSLEYDTLLVDQEGVEPVPAARFGLHGFLLKSQHGSSAVLKSLLRDRGAGKFAGDGPSLVRTREERFVLTHLEDLSPATEAMGGQSGGMTQSQARRAMEDHYARFPAARGSLQITSQFELPA